MSDRNPARNLYQRLLAIVEDAGALRKTGQTKYGEQYHFHKVDDVVDHLRPLFTKHGVVLLTSVNAGTIAECGTTQKGNAQWRAEAFVELTLVNADSPEDRATVTSWGEGIDSSDKGVGKSISYALKNALLAIFFLRGQPDVEDKHEETKRAPRNRPSEPATPPPQGEPRTKPSGGPQTAKNALQRWHEATIKGGWEMVGDKPSEGTLLAHSQFTQEEYGKGWKEMGAEELEDFFVWLLAGGDWSAAPEGYVPLKRRRIEGDVDEVIDAAQDINRKREEGK